ncbi:hypothetical protein [Mesorhizobium sp. M0895]|uniref:type I restriction enzyme subunit R domain-containing protein n=1 Tax=Mesorhizobium sp. M0895 TaxID=2957019 RepID=UPI003338FEB4
MRKGYIIHTYKFSEAVEDEVVLDLVYEARDIDQRLGSEDKIDQWFDAKTEALNDWQRDELKKKWGTMQRAQLAIPHGSCRQRHRLRSQREAPPVKRTRQRNSRGLQHLRSLQVLRAFSKKPRSAISAPLITSYNPNAQDITKEETGANTDTDRQVIYNTYTELLKGVEAKGGLSKTEVYEEAAKALFTKEPANMKLLVVVDKLLTGFDAPPCTYVYIDKSIQDHGLFP